MTRTLDDLRLQGRAVLLRPSVEDDHPAFARILSDPAVMQYLPQLSMGPGGWTLEQVAERESAFARLRKLRRALQFAVVDARSQEVLGTCGFHSLAFVSQSALFGLILGRPAWGKGVAAECHLLCFEYAFEKLGMHRIEMETDARNLRMRGFLERSSIAQEFVRKESVLDGGAFYDSVGYACFDRDWAKVKHALTARRDRQED
jgi:[ribosomal protein S5]-alanine N-acetyltransferase